MVRRAYMVVEPDGNEAVFVDYTRAANYAAQREGYLVRMYGQDPVFTTLVNKVDHHEQESPPQAR